MKKLTRLYEADSDIFYVIKSLDNLKKSITDKKVADKLEENICVLKVIKENLMKFSREFNKENISLFNELKNIQDLCDRASFE